MHTCNYRLTAYAKTGKYYITNQGALGHTDEKKADLLKEKTPTLEQIFYNILRKYPQHILKVSWYNRKDAAY